MALAQSLTAIIIFWAIIGGLGASLLLPAMQSLIHGNFEGDRAAKVVRAGRRGGRDRRRRRPAARRLHHHLPVVARRVPARGRGHRDRAVGHQARPRRAVHRARGASTRRRGAVRRRHGRRRARHPGLAGGRRVGRRAARGRRGRARLGWPTGCVRRKREGKPALLDPGLFESKLFRLGVTRQMLQQIALGGPMIALPIFLQMVLEYNAMQAGPVARAAVAEHVRRRAARRAGRLAGGARRASSASGSRSSRSAWSVLIPIVPRADSGWCAGRSRSSIAGCRARPAGVAAQQLHAVPDLGGAGRARPRA